MAVRLFVGNLPYDASEDEIREHFSSVGTLSYVFIPLDRETGKKRGFAFVEFNDEQQAQEAIRQFNNQPFKGRPLAVNEARARDASAPRPPGGGSFRPPSAIPGGFRPASAGGGVFRPPAGGGGGGGGGFRPPSGPPRSPGSGFGDPGVETPSRGDRPNRKQFGPDAKPARNRAKNFKTEGGKKSYKEKFTGQIFGGDDETDAAAEPPVDNFATSLDDEDGDENREDNN